MMVTSRINVTSPFAKMPKDSVQGAQPYTPVKELIYLENKDLGQYCPFRNMTNLSRLATGSSVLVYKIERSFLIRLS